MSVIQLPFELYAVGHSPRHQEDDHPLEISALRSLTLNESTYYVMLAIFKQSFSFLNLNRSVISWAYGLCGKARLTLSYRGGVHESVGKVLEVGSTHLNHDEHGTLDDVGGFQLEEDHQPSIGYASFGSGFLTFADYTMSIPFIWPAHSSSLDFVSTLHRSFCESGEISYNNSD